jgi:hypothetical protein
VRVDVGVIKGVAVSGAVAVAVFEAVVATRTANVSADSGDCAATGVRNVDQIAIDKKRAGTTPKADNLTR